MNERRIKIFRQVIDQLDEQLIKVLDKRYRAAARIAEIKSNSGVDIYDSDREEMIRNQAEENAEALPPELASQLIQRIIDTIREYNEENVE